MAEKIDAKYLKGLKFRSSTGRDVEEDGKKVKKYVPTERPLKPEDVLDWKDYGDKIVLVTSDGQKVTVEKDQKDPK